MYGILIMQQNINKNKCAMKCLIVMNKISFEIKVLVNIQLETNQGTMILHENISHKEVKQGG